MSSAGLSLPLQLLGSMVMAGVSKPKPGVFKGINLQHKQPSPKGIKGVELQANISALLLMLSEQQLSTNASTGCTREKWKIHNYSASNEQRWSKKAVRRGTLLHFLCSITWGRWQSDCFSKIVKAGQNSPATLDLAEDWHPENNKPDPQAGKISVLPLAGREVHQFMPQWPPEPKTIWT